MRAGQVLKSHLLPRSCLITAWLVSSSSYLSTNLAQGHQALLNTVSRSGHCRLSNRTLLIRTNHTIRWPKFRWQSFRLDAWQVLCTYRTAWICLQANESCSCFCRTRECWLNIPWCKRSQRQLWTQRKCQWRIHSAQTGLAYPLHSQRCWALSRH